MADKDLEGQRERRLPLPSNHQIEDIYTLFGIMVIILLECMLILVSMEFAPFYKENPPSSELWLNYFNSIEQNFYCAFLYTILILALWFLKHPTKNFQTIFDDKFPAADFLVIVI